MGAISESGNRNTESEDLFEEYLNFYRYSGWSHERFVEGKRKNPDYCVPISGLYFVFEVKQFEAARLTPGPGSYDPYKPIRGKINKAARQFQEYKEFPCSLVLSNPMSAFVHLDDPWAIIGAMLGNLGFQIPFEPPKGEEILSEQVFTHGGKMIDYAEPRNTTISSVIVLGRYPLRHKLITAEIKRRELALERLITVTEILEVYEAIPEKAHPRPVRVAVYDNPFARIPLDAEVFRGPYDERWSPRDGFVARVFIGPAAARLD